MEASTGQPGMFKDISITMHPYRGGHTYWKYADRLLSLQKTEPKRANRIHLAVTAAGFDSAARYAWLMEEIAKANPPNARFYASAALCGKLNFPVYVLGHSLKLMKGDDLTHMKRLGISEEQIYLAAVTDLLINYKDIKYLAETIWKGSAPPEYRDKPWDVYVGPMVLGEGAKRTGGMGIRLKYRF
jgi:hypothetical protein